MSDPKVKQLAQAHAQENVRKLVGREMQGVFTKKSSLSPAEEALVRAFYNPDKRLG